MKKISVIVPIFNVELYYSASSVMPYIASVITDANVYGVIAIIWQATFGFAMLFRVLLEKP